MGLPAEKRRSPRLPLVRDLQAHFDTAESVILTRTLDVGRHGFLIASPTLFAEGTLVHFIFTIEEPPVRLELDGIVVRVEPATPTTSGRLAVELTTHSGEWEKVYDLLASRREALAK